MAEQKAQGFTKEQIVSSKRYGHKRDLVSVLLEEGKTYTLKEVDKLIESFMKKEVK